MASIIKFIKDTDIISADVNYNFAQLNNELNAKPNVSDIDNLQSVIGNQSELLTESKLSVVEAINDIYLKVQPIGAIIAGYFKDIPKYFLEFDGGKYNVADYPRLVEECSGILTIKDDMFTLPDSENLVLEGYSELEKVGSVHAGFIPNLVGSFLQEAGGADGTLFQVAGGGTGAPNSDNTGRWVSFNASRYSNVYKDGVSRVTTNRMKVMFCIRAY